MSFLSYNPDLSGTIYAKYSKDIQQIRDYLYNAIKEAAPKWLDKPEGILGNHWNSDTPYSAHYLIWVKFLFQSISDGASKESLPRLQEKLQVLLTVKDEKKYLQYLAELEVTSFFAGGVTPLILEPLAFQDGTTSSSNRKKSPDFAFDLLTDEKRIYVEVTTLTIDKLEKWQKGVDEIVNTLRYRLINEERYLKLHVRLPLQPFEASRIIKRTWSKMRSLSAYDLPVLPGGSIRWEPYPVSRAHEDSIFSTLEKDDANALFPTTDGMDYEVLLRFKFDSDKPKGFINISPRGIQHSNLTVDKVSFVRDPHLIALTEKDKQDADEMILRRLESKLRNDKREQFPLRRQNPYFLVIKPGHYRIQGDGLINLINRHIWCHKDFEWITGIIMFTSRQGFASSSPQANISYTLNPIAKCLASASLKALFDGEKQFHASSK